MSMKYTEQSRTNQWAWSTQKKAELTNEHEVHKRKQNQPMSMKYTHESRTNQWAWSTQKKAGLTNKHEVHTRKQD